MSIASFSSTVRLLAKHPGMFTLTASFAECCAYLQGLEKGLGSQFLEDFASWLRLRDDLRAELAWPGLVLSTALGSGSRGPLSPEESNAARSELFRLLEEFLDAQLSDLPEDEVSDG